MHNKPIRLDPEPRSGGMRSEAVLSKWRRDWPADATDLEGQLCAEASCRRNIESFRLPRNALLAECQAGDSCIVDDMWGYRKSPAVCRLAPRLPPRPDQRPLGQG